LQAELAPRPIAPWYVVSSGDPRVVLYVHPVNQVHWSHGSMRVPYGGSYTYCPYCGY
jgi:hypothetical protein